MCFGSSDNGAAAAAQQQTALLEKQQQQHDADVKAGKTSIDSAFSQFDSPYFDKYKNNYVGAYQPQLNEQYGHATDSLYSTLAGTDQLGGSTGNAAMARLSKVFSDSSADVANKGADAENAFKASVDNTKGNLYTQNANAADPLSMATQAQSAAGTIVSPQSYPTMSNVFGDVLGSVATAGKTNATSKNPITNQLSSWFAPISGAGSGTVTP